MKLFYLKRRYPTRSIVGYSDIAPVRKADPGPYFDWDRHLKQAQ